MTASAARASACNSAASSSDPTTASTPHAATASPFAWLRTRPRTVWPSAIRADATAPPIAIGAGDEDLHFGPPAEAIHDNQQQLKSIVRSSNPSRKNLNVVRVEGHQVGAISGGKLAEHVLEAKEGCRMR